MHFNIHDTFTTNLPGDSILENSRRQVVEAAYSFVDPQKTAAPSLIHVSPNLALELGLSTDDITSQEFIDIFSGQKILSGTKPYAMCYGGHQFGHWAGQLGDGRAINLFETLVNGKRWALQLKGAGATPYSRSADGLAVLRSSIREHLCSEAMYHLGVPTTRSLSLMLTGNQVMRDVMYNGNSALEKGAVVCRVAPSFIRFGNFQIFASRKDEENIKRIADYTISHFYPEIISEESSKYVEFFAAVVDKTLKMIIHWQRVGFVHGVMNTDNMSILGLTIDYGPYGWLEGFDPNWTPNTTDKQNRRYRFGNQPSIALWNLYQLANALYPLIGETAPLEAGLEHFKNEYSSLFHNMMCAKLGINPQSKTSPSIITSVMEVLELVETDYTIFFRLLSHIKVNDDIDRAFQHITPAFYPDTIDISVKTEWNKWLQRYIQEINKARTSDDVRKKQMDGTNPKYVLRNYMAQIAIDHADRGDYSVISELYSLLTHPYDEQESNSKWFAKRPEWARHKIGCSMLSCSS